MEYANAPVNVLILMSISNKSAPTESASPTTTRGPAAHSESRKCEGRCAEDHKIVLGKRGLLEEAGAEEQDGSNSDEQTVRG